MFREKKYLVFSISLCLIFSFFLIGSAALLAETNQAKFPDTPAGKRAKEVIHLLNNGARQEVRQYILQQFTPDFLKMVPMERQLQIFSETQDTYKGFEVKSIQKSTDSELYAVLWAPLTESWFVFQVKLEEKESHKVHTFRLGPVSPPSGKTPPPKMTDQQVSDTLKTYMEKMAEKDIFSGTVLLAKNGKVIFKGAYGLANKRYNVPNRIDTKFNLGSMNKMFTAAAIAQLVEKGKLSYEDLVGKYLDSTWVQKETAEKVKIKHLLTHTSGLGSYFNKTFWESSRLLFRNLEDYKPLIKDEKPRFEPGTQWRYSNTGMFLLGPIIEKVSGMSYFDYIREHIYKPAGMTNSDCYDMDRPVPNLAIGYIKKFEDKGFYWRNNIYDHVIKGGPAGGGFSTVEDLVKFAQALRNNKLITRESLELLTTAKPELQSPNYGYGFTIAKKDGEPMVGHSGGFTGIRSVLRIFPKSGYTFAIMSNYNSGMTPVREKLEALLVPQLK